MHNLVAAQFLATLALSIVTTFLVSRVLYLLLRSRKLGMRKVAIVHAASFVIAYALFVYWCSTPDKIYWTAGHIAFAPQALLFIFDVLHWSDEESDLADQQESDL
jgi:hypothetical protein